MAGGGGEVAIAQTAASAFAQDKLLAIFGEVGDEFALDAVLFRAGFVAFFGEVHFHRGHAAGMTDERTLPTARAQHRFFPGVLGSFVAGLNFHGQPPDHRSTGNFDDEIFAGEAVATFAAAALAILRDQLGLKKLGDEIVKIVISFQNHTAAAPAVATAGAALGNVGFAMKRDGSLAAVAGAGENFNLVNEHNSIVAADVRRL